MGESEFFINELCQEYPELGSCAKGIKAACNLVSDCYLQGGKVLTCGNGGSCSDAGHIVGELMKSFEASRSIGKGLAGRLMGISPDRGNILASKLEQGLPAISLNAHDALTSAVLNDIGADFVFAQQVVGYGVKGDVLIAISTSGNSRNVVDAAITARAMDLYVIGLVGQDGGKLKEFCDVAICAPSVKTRKVQEYHLPIYHSICKAVEHHIFRKSN